MITQNWARCRHDQIIIGAKEIFTRNEDHPNDAQIKQFDAASRARNSGFSTRHANAFCGC
jgi:hypothetical protein